MEKLYAKDPFTSAQQAYHDYAEQERQDIFPSRLINISTGEVENGNSSKPYVIASCVWFPQFLPAVPNNSGRPMRDLVRDAFDARARLACEVYPELMQEEDNFSTLKDRIKYPSRWPESPCPSLEYLREVYETVALEALRRGVKHVWMDSVCIHQTSREDIAEQIPLMSDYYRGAQCCVVISELLRRRLYFQPYRFNADLAVEWRGGGWFNGVLLTILWWVIGFHDLRVWTFQETLLAPEVVVRAANVRIDASKTLALNFNHSNNRFHASWEKDMLPQENVGYAMGQFPMRSSLSRSGTPFSLAHHLDLLRGRNCSKLHDRIYGALGLFSTRVAAALPVDYALSIHTVAAIFAFLRICDGELAPLFLIHDKEDSHHSIKKAPSWIPGGDGIALEAAVHIRAHPKILHTVNPLTARLSIISAPFIRITRAKPKTESTASRPSSLMFLQQDDSGNMLLNFATDSNNISNIPALSSGECTAAVEPLVLYWQQPDITSLSKIEAAAAVKRGAKIRSIDSAAREGRAVLVSVGQNRPVFSASSSSSSEDAAAENGSNDWLWLVLVLVSSSSEKDSQKIWTREGIAVTRGIKWKAGLGLGLERGDFVVV